MLEVRWFKEWFLVENLKVSSDDFFFQFFNYPLLPGMVKKVTRGKVAVFTSALDIAQTETKGTVLSKTLTRCSTLRREKRNISKRCIIITSTLPILTFFPKDLQRDRRRWYQNYHRRIKYRRTISTLSQPIQHRCPKSPLQIRSSSSMLSRKRHTFSPSRRSHSRRNWFRRHS